MQADPMHNKRLRGLIVEVVYIRHLNQQPRLDNVELAHILRDMGRDVAENLLLAQLQDLHDRGYMIYREDKNRITGRVTILQMQLTSRGRDLNEKTIEDPAVQID